MRPTGSYCSLAVVSVTEHVRQETIFARSDAGNGAGGRS